MKAMVESILKGFSKKKIKRINFKGEAKTQKE